MKKERRLSGSSSDERGGGSPPRGAVLQSVINRQESASTSPFSGRPIFVVGAPRSGTTLLAFMLCSHPRICILRESHFIPRLFQRCPQAPMSRKQAIRNVKIIFGYRTVVRHWKGERPDPAAFVDVLPDLTPRTFLSAFYARYARQQGAERWGDKSPTYTEHMDLLADIFPDSQFIHLIRDGRDVALSMIEALRHDRFYVDVYFAARTWKERIRKAFASAGRLGQDRYLELRYEQLTAHPQAELCRMCDFLGESYHAAMAEPHLLARQLLRPAGLHAAVRQPPSTVSSGRWRREMSESDQRLFQSAAGDLLGELGYETVNLDKMYPGERARLTGLQTKFALLKAGQQVLRRVGMFLPAWSAPFKIAETTKSARSAARALKAYFANDVVRSAKSRRK